MEWELLVGTEVKAKRDPCDPPGSQKGRKPFDKRVEQRGAVEAEVQRKMTKILKVKVWGQKSDKKWLNTDNLHGNLNDKLWLMVIRHLRPSRYNSVQTQFREMSLVSIERSKSKRDHTDWQSVKKVIARSLAQITIFWFNLAITFFTLGQSGWYLLHFIADI